MSHYRVIDKNKAHTKSYLGIVFIRNERVKEHLSLSRWISLTCIEMVVGSEILESIVTTGSVPPYKTSTSSDSEEYGAELHLTLHIPSGFVTNFLRPHIIELLYYKFYNQYLLLAPVSEPYIDDELRAINCTRVRFRARKRLFYQLIALRRVYDLSWLIFNVSVDLLVYCGSGSIEWALLSALTIEGVRRLLKI